MVEWENNVISPLFGYKSGEEYCKSSGCENKVPFIKVPTFIIMCKDDPVVGEKSINYECCTQNENVLLAIIDRGGHLGYYTNPFSPK